MPKFDEYFSEEAIIKRLCKIRIKQAGARHKRLFYRQISSDAPVPETFDPASIFPPRRQWHRFRNRCRPEGGTADQNLIALTRATLRLRAIHPTEPWVQRLNERVRVIRERVLRSISFAFAAPTIRAEAKAPKSDEYRAIAQFAEDDQVIEGITAAYFRQAIDELFVDSCLAFRCGSKVSPPPTHHDAVTRIENYRRRHLKAGLYVAECDIKGFFDCVSHDVATASLSRLIEQARSRVNSFEVHPRALQIFRAYLDCYSFPVEVKTNAEPLLQQKMGPKAHFKWPEEALRKFHREPRLARIGIPQGGALSCFIANCVLHYADLRVRRTRSETPGPFRYLRYCDDMVILAPNETSCRIAFEAYQEALQHLQLPAHPPAAAEVYNASFWAGKSRHPYCWARPLNSRTVPWFQFVGYQIRHDGTLRVKRKSIDKHKAKILVETNRLLRTLTPTRLSIELAPSFGSGIRKSAHQILHRFRQKLIAMSVGRREVHDDLGQWLPKCWAAGFKMLHGRRISIGALKELDRFRERQIARIRSTLRKLPRIVEPSETTKNMRAPLFYGSPFSYVGQFLATGRVPASRNRRRKGDAQ